MRGAARVRIAPGRASGLRRNFRLAWRNRPHTRPGVARQDARVAGDGWRTATRGRYTAPGRRWRGARPPCVGQARLRAGTVAGWDSKGKSPPPRTAPFAPQWDAPPEKTGNPAPIDR